MQFINDVGFRPSPKHTIDRVDNNQGYTPDNVRWTTKRVQAQNTRRNRLVPLKGETLAVAEVARLLGISRHTMKARFRRGWSGDKLTDSRTNPPRVEWIDKAVALAKSGHSTLKISETLGIKRRVVQEGLRRWGVKAAKAERPLLTCPQKRAEALEMVKRGVPVRVISRQLGLSRTAINTAVRFSSLPSDVHGDAS